MKATSKPTARIALPPKLIPIFSGPARYRVAYGGRGSGKTRSFALMAAVQGYRLAEEGKRGLIFCGREFMNSLEESSMEEVKAAIADTHWLASYYEVGQQYIRTKNRAIEFSFGGLRHNLDSLKSKARIHLAWIDEAESVSELAWSKLIPTIREAGSEIWVTYNPERKDSATNRRFRLQAPDDCKHVLINWQDNPRFPAVLESARRHDENTLDGPTYQWIWEGAYRENSKAQIFAGVYRVEEFEPGEGWDGPYYGLDFGFAQDPTAAVKAWIYDDTVYIEQEAGAIGLELDETVPLLAAKMPGIEAHKVRADNARPESISHLKRRGLPRIEAVEKGKGSVEDGISWIRSRRVVIHPRCKATSNEFRLYSYKVDRLSGDVLPVIVDSHNHYIDALRYALAPIIKNKRKAFAVA